MEKIEIPLTSLFVKSHPELPDSRGAGKIIKVLDKYLDLDVDYEPLMETAKEMEDKLKELRKQLRMGKEKKELPDKSRNSYLG